MRLDHKPAEHAAPPGESHNDLGRGRVLFASIARFLDGLWCGLTHQEERQFLIENGEVTREWCPTCKEWR